MLARVAEALELRGASWSAPAPWRSSVGVLEFRGLGVDELGTGAGGVGRVSQSGRGLPQSGRLARSAGAPAAAASSVVSSAPVAGWARLAGTLAPPALGGSTGSGVD